MELRTLVQEFLVLVRKGSGNQERDESALARLLDALALGLHDVQYTFDDRDYPDPPVWSYEERRSLASERFPEYGYYNVALPVSVDPSQAEVVVGDAIDDIADIAGELCDVSWRWSNTSSADALWNFEYSFQSHWGQHLRHLQLYLYSLRQGA